MARTKIAIPTNYANNLPSPKSITALKQTEPVIVPASIHLHRAAWTPTSVLPSTVERFYRFGPPEDAVIEGKPPPYWWLYIADAVRTCVYEAGFVRHDKTSRGQSYIDPDAAQVGQIASIVFPEDLRL